MALGRQLHHRQLASAALCIEALQRKLVSGDGPPDPLRLDAVAQRM